MLRSTSLPLVEMHRLAEAFPAVSSETILVGADSPLAGKTLKELDIRHQTGATVMAIDRNGNLEINPDPELRVEVGDILTLIGTTDQLKMAIEFMKEGKAEAPAAPGDAKAGNQLFSTRHLVNGGSDRESEIKFT
jgi:K+/H+ antiporter YhaU regulatory subunit KhtT